jgi:hypothetical protein
MRAAVALGIAILSAASWNSAAEARGVRGGGSYGGGTLVRVSGYVNSRGTYVAPHYRTKADGILSNNLSYRGGSSSYTYQGSVPVASADPLDVPATTVASLSQPASPRVKMPWCSDGTIVSGFCVLN